MKTYLTLILLLSVSLLGASFDCAKAKTNVEKMICADPELSALDENLSKTFKEALKSTDNKEQLKKEQIEWIKERNRCQDIFCVQSMYSFKIQTLTQNVPTIKGDLNVTNEVNEYLNLGDIYLKSYTISKNIEDKTKGIGAYKKYIELLRTQNSIPTIPFRVAKEVFLKNQLTSPYPDVWGYDNGYRIEHGEFEPNNIRIHKLTNGDIVVEDSFLGQEILFFSKVKFHYEKELNTYITKEQELSDRLHILIDKDKYIFQDTPIVLEDGIKLMYNGLASNANFTEHFVGTFILHKQGRLSKYFFMYRIKENKSFTKAKMYEDSSQSGKLSSNVWDITSYVDNIIMLDDGTFIVDLGMTAIRFNSNFESKAPFLNQTVFRLDEKDREQILKVSINHALFQQARYDEASKIITKKMKEGK